MWRGGVGKGRRQQNQSGACAWLPLLKFQSLPSTHRLTEGTVGAQLFPPPAPASMKTEGEKGKTQITAHRLETTQRKEEPFLEPRAAFPTLPGQEASSRPAPRSLPGGRGCRGAPFSPEGGG